jgi:hypothetical protein
MTVILKFVYIILSTLLIIYYLYDFDMVVRTYRHTIDQTLYYILLPHVDIALNFKSINQGSWEI